MSRILGARKRFGLAVLALMSCVSSGVALPANAQSAAEVLQNPQSGNLQQDLNGGNFNVLNLVNQAVLRGGGQTPEQFNQGQQRNLNDAVANFRQQQQLQIGPQIIQPGAAQNPAAAPQPATSTQ